MPTHVAVVMDGNGRWAQQRGLKRTEGHAAGEEALFDTVDGALDIGLQWLTVYAFSTENWRRPLDEVRFLMNFNERLLRRAARRSQRAGRAGAVHRPARRAGARPGAPPHRGDRGADRGQPPAHAHVRVQLRRSGRDRRRGAARSRRKSPTGRLDPEKIDERTIARHLYAPDMPDPDLLVRTSGEYRISNYLLWELAYSELVFTDVLWPDFRTRDLVDAIAEYQRRDRRFGAI